jgi:LemA protein
MKNELTIIVTIIVTIIISSIVVTFKCIGVVNQAIAHEEDVKRAKGNIEIEEQRRFDLLPNLVKCIKQYSEYEYETLNKIVNERAQFNDTTNFEESTQHIDSINFKKRMQDIDTTSFEEILFKINGIVQRYPELKTTENYLNFTTELKATENRISENRQAYNWTVYEYNKYVRKVRHKLILELSNYEIKNYEYYDATESEIKNF